MGYIILHYIGQSFSTIPKPTTIRICNGCLDEDRQSGFPYFRRSHQIPGVNYCWKHHTPLVDTDIRISGLRKLISAKKAVPNTDTSSQYLLRKNRKPAFLLADDAHWLLTQHNLQCDPSQLHARYKIALESGGWLTNGGKRIRVSSLVDKFKAYYSQEFLESLSSTITDTEYSWIESLYSAQLRTWPPIRHLLLIQCLGYSAQEFFTLPIIPPEQEHSKPFGHGPWPCLNKCCKHYKKLVIYNCVLKYEYYKKQYKAIFACECGFSYACFLTNTSNENPYSYDQVQQYGHVWETKFAELWHSDLSIADQIEQLGLNNYATYHRQAERIGLRKVGNNQVDVNIVQLPSVKLRHRDTWLKARKEYPSASISQLRNTLHIEYDYLRLYDREWFSQNTPSPKLKNLARIDWNKVDRDLSEKIDRVGKHCQNSPFIHEWISRKMLLQKAGWQQAFTKRAQALMPLTKLMLAHYAETHDQYCQRCLYWAEEQFRAEGTIPSENQLLVKARLLNSRHKDVVKVTVSEILDRFHALQQVSGRLS